MLSFVCLLVEFGNLGGVSNDLKSLRSIPVGVFILVVMLDRLGILGETLISFC